MLAPLRRRLLLPREHGAVAQTLLPLASALIVLDGSGGWLPWLCALAGLASLWMHEALLVIGGRRGARARREQGRRAWGILLALASFVGTTLGTAWFLAPRFGTLVVLALAAAALFLLWRGQERSALGEILATTTLTSWCLLLLLAGGKDLRFSLSLWASWMGSLVSATLLVRVVVLHVEMSRLRRVVSVVLRATPLWGLLLLARIGEVERGFAFAALPVVVLAGAVVLFSPPARAVPRVGWSLAVASVVQVLALSQML